MSLRRRKNRRPPFEAPDLVALAERATRLDNHEIFTAVDTTLSNLGRYVSEYRQTMNSDYLGELMLGAQALYVMAAELSVRRGEPPAGTPTRQPRPSRPY